jgi:hypothetical protein
MSSYVLGPAFNMKDGFSVITIAGFPTRRKKDFSQWVRRSQLHPVQKQFGC